MGPAKTRRPDPLEGTEQLLAESRLGIQSRDNRLSLRPKGVRQGSEIPLGPTT